MEKGCRISFPLSRQPFPYLLLLNHTFHTKISSFRQETQWKKHSYRGGESQVSNLPLPSLPFQTGSRGGLCLSLQCYPPYSPSSCFCLLPEIRDTPNVTPSLVFLPPDQLFCDTECVTGPFSASQEILHPAKVVAGKDTQPQAQLVLNFSPVPLFFFGIQDPSLKKKKKILRAG